MTSGSATHIDAQRFRQVLGSYPTGVTVITAIAEDGSPAGMAVGSFTSVSLDPPLVGFFPGKFSSSWPRVRAAGGFAANILADHQEHVCRALAARGGDKFAGLGWRPAGNGAPILDGVTAWIECEIESVTDAGDHWFVLGRVLDLEVAEQPRPLVFFQGGYARISALPTV
jgi:3-hydroxy-9,10-secoandrosta-1,3,5(10)-triene-9,17-dione monooxygenase reductase component